MQLKYKISVIIPTFNAEDYLLEAFESIKNQSMGFESIEVILVDDKSSDKTPDLIKELSKEYENVKSIILEENTGTASGPRNKGIEESSADYVIFLDNDDIYSYDIDELKPIPLTPDILEKNGWVYNNDDEKFFPQTWVGGGLMLRSAGDCGYRIVVTSDYDDEDTNDTPFIILYVHELQHALRMCGIEKEIEI